MLSDSSTPPGLPNHVADANRSPVVRFGMFEADLHARELRKSGRRIRLQEQPFSLLAVLLERPATLVTREELRQRLWPADTFVDFDHSLNTAVNKLREVLGDSASNPRFIETLARRGYRFVAEVQQADVQQEVVTDKHDRAVKTEMGNVGLSSADPILAPKPGQELPDDLPVPHRALTRSLFGLIQVMYLAFYAAALINSQAIDNIAWPDIGTPVVLIAVLVTAAVGIPLRLYLLTGVAFDHPRLGEKFSKIFLGILVLDQLWATAPFLLMEKIGFGAALGATAALLYVPFAERTLIRMAYRKPA